MQAHVAVYTFAICVFVAFLLWGSQNLGVIGLLSAFSIGLISYSMDSSIETAVASVVIAGVLIKFILPTVQAKWFEAYADYNATAIAQPIHSAEKTTARITAMRSGEKNIEGFRGLAPQLLEGFANGPTAGLAAAIPGTRMAGAGGTATTTQLPQAPAAAPTAAPAMNAPRTSMGPTTVPGVGGVATVGGVSNQQVGQTGQSAPILNATYKPDQGSMAQQTANQLVQQPVPTGTSSLPTFQMTAPPATTAPLPAGTNNLGAISSPGSASLMPSQAMPSIPTTITGTASLAAPATSVPSTLPQVANTGIDNTTSGMGTTTGATTGMGAPELQATATNAAQTMGTALGGQQQGQLPPGTTVSNFRNIERFEEQPQQVPGMFKLGELPSESKGGPHIDAGTTIMRALGALNPDQISSLTEDTRKLLDTQKSLMGMLSTMKPMLSDGQNLLASFTNMFGKPN